MRRLHGTVVAYLALFLALSTGGAIAATKLGASDIKKDAIRSRHIKNGQVRGPDLRANAVSSTKVKDGSIGPADLANDAVTSAKIQDGAVGTGDIANDAVTGAKVADDTITGADVNESSLGQVPDAAKVGGLAPSAFIPKTVYKKESTLGPGTDKGDGTFVMAEACNGSDVLLSGGPANINATTSMVESFPSPGSTNSWSVRIRPAAADNFSVVILCAGATP